MKKLFLVGLVILILLLDFAALDDITTRNEPSLMGEYLMVMISVPALIVIGYLLRKNQN